MNNISIKVENLTKVYPLYNSPLDRLKEALHPFRKKYHTDFYALEDISFELTKGKTFGIIGKNGAGKSTLLKIIAGVLSPSSGEITVNGRVASLLELGAGFNPEMTGRENIHLNCTILGMTKQEINEKFEAITLFADIGNFIDQPVKIYSSGMFVRLAFAIIANINAEILIIDEALAVGDILFTQKCMRFLKTFQKQGTLLFVSHDSVSVLSLCEQAMWLDKGKIQSIGNAKEVVESYLASQGSSDGRATAGNKPELSKNEELLSEQDQEFYTEKSRFKIFDAGSETWTNAFGERKIEIQSVRLINPLNQQTLQIAYGGELVELCIEAKAIQEVKNLIFGFYVKNKTGMRLFAANTYLQTTTEMDAAADERVLGRFLFKMPVLLSGEYTIDAIIASGTQRDHILQHWIYDALVFRGTDSTMGYGLVGVPMTKVVLEKKPA
ncbi:MAG: transporter ATP-binding protein [Gammaproteobacteria bacterium]|jgi:lipopolysaccharide transport system ATP-binding protein|nr:transporter ATP-binding protein [Gammaproteobacteria bacterium]